MSDTKKTNLRGPSHIVSGEYSLYKKTLSGEIIPIGTHKNMILNGGIARLHSGGVPAVRIAVGTGTSLESPEQTSLESEVLATTNRITNTFGGSSSPRPNRYSRQLFQFSPQPSAYNFTEIGLGNAGDLFSRALIRDSNGDPTTISVLAGEILYAQYIMRIFHDQEPITGTVTIKDTVHTYYMAPYNVGYTGSSLLSRPSTFDNCFPLFTASSDGLRIGNNMPSYFPPESPMVSPSLSVTAGTQVSDQASWTATGETSKRIEWRITTGAAIGGEGVVYAIVQPYGVPPGAPNDNRYATMFFSFDPPIPKPALETFALAMECSFATV